MKNKILLIVPTMLMCFVTGCSTSASTNTQSQTSNPTSISQPTQTTTINLIKNGGAGGNNFTIAKLNESINKVDIPAKPGHTFLGYFEGESESSTLFINPYGYGVTKWTNTANVANLYAHWLFTGSTSATIDMPETEEVPYLDGGSNEYNLVTKDFDNVIKSSAPTKIITNQFYHLNDEDIYLHYNSTLLVSYESEVTTSYSYSYDKLNTIVTGGEQMYSTITDTVYSKGSSVGNGYIWFTSVEQSLTISSVDMSCCTEENCDYIKIDGLLATYKLKNDNVILTKFFKNYFPIRNLMFTILLTDVYGDLKVSQIEIEYDSTSLNSHTSIVSYYSYKKETVNIPQ